MICVFGRVEAKKQLFVGSTRSIEWGEGRFQGQIGSVGGTGRIEKACGQSTLI